MQIELLDDSFVSGEKPNSIGGIMNNEYLEHKVKGIATVHLKAAYQDEGVLCSHPPMDYHLHFMLYHDTESDCIGTLCLDTGDITRRPFNRNSLRSDFKLLCSDLVEMFVDRIDSMLKKKEFIRDLLFMREPQENWDLFNKLKEDSFLKELPRFAEYLGASNAGVSTESLEEKPEEYHWAKYTYSEERMMQEA